jgi:hypothetical protein
MYVDESAKTLAIYGSFQQAPGSVFVMDSLMPVTTWTDTLIQLSLPDSGHASYGPVRVRQSSAEDTAYLTAWDIRMNNSSNRYWGQGSENEYGQLRFRIRMDATNSLRLQEDVTITSVAGATGSWSYYKTDNGSTTSKSGTFNDSPFARGTFRPKQRKLELRVPWLMKSLTFCGETTALTLDSTFVFSRGSETRGGTCTLEELRALPLSPPPYLPKRAPGSDTVLVKPDSVLCKATYSGTWFFEGQLKIVNTTEDIIGVPEDSEDLLLDNFMLYGHDSAIVNFTYNTNLVTLPSTHTFPVEQRFIRYFAGLPIATYESTIVLVDRAQLNVAHPKASSPIVEVSSGNLTLTGLPAHCSYRLYDVSGRCLLIGVLQEEKLQLSDLLPGTYLFNYSSEDEQKTLKISIPR